MKIFSFRPLLLVAALCLFPGAVSAKPEKILAPLADGFDYPVGKPDAVGYYKARGFWPGVHPGEDWNGKGGGNTDLGDAVYSIANGVVVASADYKRGWGHCVIVRHAYRAANGKVVYVDSQYAHLNVRNVKLHQVIERGTKVGTIGTAHGKYLAHLHFEIRKNLRIGMNRSQFPRTYEHYYNPTSFIEKYRKLEGSRRRHAVPVNTFAAYGSTSYPASASDSPSGKIPKVPEDESRKLDPKLKKRIAANKPDAIKEEEFEGFWSRLKERIKNGEPTGGVTQ